MQIAFTAGRKAANNSIPNKVVERELLHRAIANPVIGRLPIFIPIAIICIAASALPQKHIFWMLAAAFTIVTFLAAIAAGQVKNAIKTGKTIQKATIIWLGSEFVATAIWGSLLGPVSDAAITGSARTAITAVILVTLTTACLFASNALGQSKTAIAGFALTALPIAIYNFAEYGFVMIGGAIIMFACLIHLVSKKQEEAVENLRTELENKRLTSQLADALDTAQYLSSHDSLTGLLNRRDFEATARELRNTNAGAQIAIILLDLDHFKKVNDQFGHAMGDDVLKAVADVIKSPVRAQHISAGAHEAVARWGGEEFVIALAQTNLQEAKIVAERICQTLAQYRKSDWPVALKLTASIGVATWELTEPLNEALDRADLAMFKAKSQGRNNVQISGEIPAKTLVRSK